MQKIAEDKKKEIMRTDWHSRLPRRLSVEVPPADASGLGKSTATTPVAPIDEEAGDDAPGEDDTSDSDDQEFKAGLRYLHTLGKYLKAPSVAAPSIDPSRGDTRSPLTILNQELQTPVSLQKIVPAEVQEQDQDDEAVPFQGPSFTLKVVDGDRDQDYRQTADLGAVDSENATGVKGDRRLPAPGDPITSLLQPKGAHA